MQLDYVLDYKKGRHCVSAILNKMGGKFETTWLQCAAGDLCEICRVFLLNSNLTTS